MSIEITVTPSRNEHSIVFNLNKDILPPGKGLSFPAEQFAQAHPLAKALFNIKGVVSVWIIGSEIQVTKDEKTRWGSIKGVVEEAIQASFKG